MTLGTWFVGVLLLAFVTSSKQNLVTNGDLVPAILKPGIWQAGLSRNLPHWLVEGDITFATSATTDHSIIFLKGSLDQSLNTVKGQQYEFSCKLRVALSGRHADRFVVTVIDEGDGKQIVVDQSQERMTSKWSTRRLVFEATSSHTQLRLTAHGGVEVDAVQVTAAEAGTRLRTRGVPPVSKFLFQRARAVSVLATTRNPGNAQLAMEQANVNVTFGPRGGSQWRSVEGFFGLFQTTLRCPPPSSDGVVTSFFLESDGSRATGIAFKFSSLDSFHVALSWKVEGRAHSTTKPLHFDCSSGDHLYSIYWHPRHIVWYADRKELHSLVKVDGEPYPKEPLVLKGAIGGPLSKASTAPPSTAKFTYVSYSPLAGPPIPPVALPQFGVPAGGNLVFPVAADYCPEHCVGCAANNFKGAVSVRFDSLCGSRWQAPGVYASGVFSADLKCGGGATSGLNFNFYLSSRVGPGQDEIDFEILGNNRSAVQTNYYVNGVGGNEELTPLDFDCASGFHNFAVEYNPYNIIWWVDNKVVRVVLNTSATTGKPYPSQTLSAYASVWDASFVCDGCWTGRRDPSTLVGNWSTVTYFQNIRVLAPI